MIFLCVVTSFIYTELYLVDGDEILELVYFKNIYFQEHIVKQINHFFEKYPIELISLFTGPAPLISCRVSLIFFQALLFIKKIPCILCCGFLFYEYSLCDFTIIQNFSGKYIVLEKDSKIKEVTIDELKMMDLHDMQVGFVCRENHIIDTNGRNMTILFPNREEIIKKTLEKIKKNKQTILYEKIIPFL